MPCQAFHRTCGMQSRIRNYKNKEKVGIGPIHDSTIHIRR